MGETQDFKSIRVWAALGIAVVYILLATSGKRLDSSDRSREKFRKRTDPSLRFIKRSAPSNLAC